MADEKDTKPGGASAARETSDGPPAREEPKFARARLIEEAEDRFGYPSWVVVGALADERKQNLTVAEVQAALAEYHRRPASMETETAPR